MMTDYLRSEFNMNEHKQQLLPKLQQEVVRTRQRRRQRRTSATLATLLMIGCGLLWFTQPAPRSTPPVAAGPAPVETASSSWLSSIIVGNLPGASQDVVVSSQQVDHSGLEFTSLSDDELMALLEGDLAPVNVARIDDRLVAVPKP